jgi:hypothetical protein
VWFQPPQNWLAQRLYNENSKETAKETNENRKWNWKRNRNKTESDPINKNEPWTDKLKMNWLTAQTKWIISKWASRKGLRQGGRVATSNAMRCFACSWSSNSDLIVPRAKVGPLGLLPRPKRIVALWPATNSCVVLLRNVQVSRRNSDS